MLWRDIGHFAEGLLVISLTVIVLHACGIGEGLGVGPIVTLAAMFTIIRAIREPKCSTP